MTDAQLPLAMLRAGTVPRGRLGRGSGTPGVQLEVITGFAAATVNARKEMADAVASRLSALAGVPVGQQSRRVAGKSVSVTGVAPGQWFAVAGNTADVEFAEKLALDLAGVAAVTAQGNGRVILHLSGPKARATLAKGVPIDLHSTVFPVGSVAQTTAGHIGIGVALLDDTPTFELISAASTRGSLLTWLVSSAAEYGIEVR